MRPTTEVRGATPDEMPRAIAAIVAAFLTDPIARFAWPSPHDHLRAMPLATREFARDSFDYGTAMSPPTSAAPRSGCLPGYMRPSTMRAGVGSHGLGCWPVARKRRSAVATRAIPARTRNPPAASVIDGGNGKRNGRTSESMKTSPAESRGDKGRREADSCATVPALHRGVRHMPSRKGVI